MARPVTVTRRSFLAQVAGSPLAAAAVSGCAASSRNTGAAGDGAPDRDAAPVNVEAMTERERAEYECLGSVDVGPYSDVSSRPRGTPRCRTESNAKFRGVRYGSNGARR